MIVQGSNNPLVIKFDKTIDDIPTLIITLWKDRTGYNSVQVKKWERPDMIVSGDTAICQIEERETRAFSSPKMILEAKGLDGNGNTIFWDEYPVDIKRRRDKIILLTGV